MRSNISRLLSVAIFSCLLLLTSAPLRAVTLEFLLSTPDETYNSLNIIVEPEGFDPVSEGSNSDDSDVTGLLVAELGLQVVGSDVVVTELALIEKPLEPEERLLEFSNVQFTYELALKIDGVGLGGSMTTRVDPPNTPPSAVDNGQFDAAEQQLTIGRGFFNTSFGGFPADSRDMSEPPFPFIGPSNGTGIIDLVETSRVGSRVTYDVTLTVPVQVEETIVLDLTVFMQVDGTLQGSTTEWTYYGADFDHDLDVDGEDFLTWQRGLGTMGSAAQTDGDANLDTHVDALDLAAWQGQFGTSPTTQATTVATVPEPNTVTLVLILGSLLVLPRNRTL